ncbi:MAG: hypothetical protein M1830_000946, partial [Pleopsidium flavum]
MGKHTMGRTKKRNHAQYAQDSKLGAETTNKFGVASTLSQLRVPDLPKFNLTSAKCGSEGDKDERSSEGWEIVDRRSKKQKLAPDEKKEKSSYPALNYAGHRLQASIKISDLQGLVIYTLADGTAPQWISVRHHHHIKKVMVLMVPGLENGMFDGKIPFHERIRNGDVDRSPLAAHNGEHESNGHKPTNGSGDNQAKGTRSTRVATLSPDDYLPVPLSPHQLAEPLQPLADIFPHIWPVKTPGDDRYYKVHSPIHAMLTPPLPKSKEEKQEEKDVKGAKPAREGKRWENKRTRISAFLASAEELEENEYTLHPVLFPTEIEKEREMLRREQTFETAESGWVDTKVDSLDNGGVPEQEVQQGSLTAGKEILTMDCEMCKTEGGGLDLTRISIVSWDGNVVMDELVKPEKPIIDYLTPYSGITAAKLKQVTTTLLDIQTRLLSMLHPRSILIGHSLNSDLNALKLTHPFIIDTSIIYQHPRGPPLKSSLKWLSQKYLGREIQKGHGTHGHDSIEDARACLDLVKQKCEKGVKWGTSEAAGESIFKRLARSPRTGSSGISGNDDGKIGAIIDWGTPERNFGAMAK